MTEAEARWLRMTPEALRAFQAANYNHVGAKLKVDGDLGPQTRWALAMQTLPKRRQLTVWRAICCLGLDEKLGSNRHPVFDLMLKRCLAALGEPYCAALASDAIGDVAIPGAMALLNNYPPTLNPWPGDLAGFRTGPWQGHVYVVGGTTRTEIMGPEGNSANMCRMTRRWRSQLQFARVFNDAEELERATMPGIPQFPALPFVETKATLEDTR